MGVCKQCKGKGYLVVKDDVWKHLTGRGKPPKTKKCHHCNGSGEVSKSGAGCLWTVLLVLGLIAMVFIFTGCMPSM